MFRSIRFRIALWYSLLVALTFVVISWTIYEYLKRTLAVTLDQSIVGEAEWVAARYDRGISRHEPDSLTREDMFEHAAFFPIKEYVEVWDAGGSLYYHSVNLAQDTLVEYATLTSADARLPETVTRFRNHDIRLLMRKSATSTVIMAMPTESITQPVVQLLRILGWLGPAVILAAIFTGLALAKKSFSKINQVIETAQSITVDRLHDRIPEQETQDEIGKIISTFNEMISRLDVSFRQMKQFSADASHELRTPLSVMRTQLEGALLSKASISEIKTIAANCLDETLRMSSIIDNLLLLARADADRESVERVPVRLDALVRTMYDESVMIASERSIKVSLVTVENATIMGDAVRLRQMFLNLIDNAVKYNHDRGAIEISLTKRNGTANIIIADTGIGIPESEVPRIFDRFYRVDRARSREMGGSGLGLSIVHWIVSAHGGSIKVKSILNKGSEFSVSFPLAG